MGDPYSNVVPINPLAAQSLNQQTASPTVEFNPVKGLLESLAALKPTLPPEEQVRIDQIMTDPNAMRDELNGLQQSLLDPKQPFLNDLNNGNYLARGLAAMGNSYLGQPYTETYGPQKAQSYIDAELRRGAMDPTFQNNLLYFVEAQQPQQPQQPQAGAPVAGAQPQADPGTLALINTFEKSGISRELGSDTSKVAQAVSGLMKLGTSVISGAVGGTAKSAIGVAQWIADLTGHKDTATSLGQEVEAISQVQGQIKESAGIDAGSLSDQVGETIGLMLVPLGGVKIAANLFRGGNLAVKAGEAAAKAAGTRAKFVKRQDLVETALENMMRSRKAQGRSIIGLMSLEEAGNQYTRLRGAGTDEEVKKAMIAAPAMGMVTAGTEALLGPIANILGRPTKSVLSQVPGFKQTVNALQRAYASGDAGAVRRLLGSTINVGTKEAIQEVTEQVAQAAVEAGIYSRPVAEEAKNALLDSFRDPETGDITATTFTVSAIVGGLFGLSSHIAHGRAQKKQLGRIEKGIEAAAKDTGTLVLDADPDAVGAAASTGPATGETAAAQRAQARAARATGQPAQPAAQPQPTAAPQGPLSDTEVTDVQSAVSTAQQRIQEAASALDAAGVPAPAQTAASTLREQPIDVNDPRQVAAQADNLDQTLQTLGDTLNNLKGVSRQLDKELNLVLVDGNFNRDSLKLPDNIKSVIAKSPAAAQRIAFILPQLKALASEVARIDEFTQSPQFDELEGEDRKITVSKLRDTLRNIDQARGELLNEVNRLATRAAKTVSDNVIILPVGKGGIAESVIAPTSREADALTAAMSIPSLLGESPLAKAVRATGHKAGAWPQDNAESLRLMEAVLKLPDSKIDKDTRQRLEDLVVYATQPDRFFTDIAPKYLKKLGFKEAARDAADAAPGFAEFARQANLGVDLDEVASDLIFETKPTETYEPAYVAFADFVTGGAQRAAASTVTPVIPGTTVSQETVTGTPPGPGDVLAQTVKGGFTLRAAINNVALTKRTPEEILAKLKEDGIDPIALRKLANAQPASFARIIKAAERALITGDSGLYNLLIERPGLALRRGRAAAAKRKTRAVESAEEAAVNSILDVVNPILAQAGKPLSRGQIKTALAAINEVEQRRLAATPLLQRIKSKITGAKQPYARLTLEELGRVAEAIQQGKTLPALTRYGVALSKDLLDAQDGARAIVNAKLAEVKEANPDTMAGLTRDQQLEALRAALENNDTAANKLQLDLSSLLQNVEMTPESAARAFFDYVVVLNSGDVFKTVPGEIETREPEVAARETLDKISLAATGNKAGAPLRQQHLDENYWADTEYKNASTQMRSQLAREAVTRMLSGLRVRVGLTGEHYLTIDRDLLRDKEYRKLITEDINKALRLEYELKQAQLAQRAAIRNKVGTGVTPEQIKKAILKANADLEKAVQALASHRGSMTRKYGRDIDRIAGSLIRRLKRGQPIPQKNLIDLLDPARYTSDPDEVKTVLAGEDLSEIDVFTGAAFTALREGKIFGTPADMLRVISKEAGMDPFAFTGAAPGKQLPLDPEAAGIAMRDYAEAYLMMTPEQRLAHEPFKIWLAQQGYRLTSGAFGATEQYVFEKQATAPDGTPKAPETITEREASVVDVADMFSDATEPLTESEIQYVRDNEELAQGMAQYMPQRQRVAISNALANPNVRAQMAADLELLLRKRDPVIANEDLYKWSKIAAHARLQRVFDGEFLRHRNSQKAQAYERLVTEDSAIVAFAKKTLAELGKPGGKVENLPSAVRRRIDVISRVHATAATVLQQSTEAGRNAPDFVPLPAESLLNSIVTGDWSLGGPALTDIAAEAWNQVLLAEFQETYGVDVGSIADDVMMSTFFDKDSIEAARKAVLKKHGGVGSLAIIRKKIDTLTDGRRAQAIRALSVVHTVKGALPSLGQGFLKVIEENKEFLDTNGNLKTDLAGLNETVAAELVQAIAKRDQLVSLQKQALAAVDDAIQNFGSSQETVGDLAATLSAAMDLFIPPDYLEIYNTATATPEGGLPRSLLSGLAILQPYHSGTDPMLGSLLDHLGALDSATAKQAEEIITNLPEHILLGEPAHATNPTLGDYVSTHTVREAARAVTALAISGRYSEALQIAETMMPNGSAFRQAMTPGLQAALQATRDASARVAFASKENETMWEQAKSSLERMVSEMSVTRTAVGRTMKRLMKRVGVKQYDNKSVTKSLIRAAKATRDVQVKVVTRGGIPVVEVTSGKPEPLWVERGGTVVRNKLSNEQTMAHERFALDMMKASFLRGRLLSPDLMAIIARQVGMNEAMAGFIGQAKVLAFSFDGAFDGNINALADLFSSEAHRLEAQQLVKTYQEAQDSLSRKGVEIALLDGITQRRTPNLAGGIFGVLSSGLGTSLTAEELASEATFPGVVDFAQRLLFWKGVQTTQRDLRAQIADGLKGGNKAHIRSMADKMLASAKAAYEKKGVGGITTTEFFAVRNFAEALKRDPENYHDAINDLVRAVYPVDIATQRFTTLASVAKVINRGLGPRDAKIRIPDIGEFAKADTAQRRRRLGQRKRVTPNGFEASVNALQIDADTPATQEGATMVDIAARQEIAEREAAAQRAAVSLANDIMASVDNSGVTFEDAVKNALDTAVDDENLRDVRDMLSAVEMLSSEGEDRFARLQKDLRLTSSDIDRMAKAVGGIKHALRDRTGRALWDIAFQRHRETNNPPQVKVTRLQDGTILGVELRGAMALDQVLGVMAEFPDIDPKRVTLADNFLPDATMAFGDYHTEADAAAIRAQQALSDVVAIPPKSKPRLGAGIRTRQIAAAVDLAITGKNADMPLWNEMFRKLVSENVVEAEPSFGGVEILEFDDANHQIRAHTLGATTRRPTGVTSGTAPKRTLAKGAAAKTESVALKAADTVAATAVETVKAPASLKTVANNIFTRLRLNIRARRGIGSFTKEHWGVDAPAGSQLFTAIKYLSDNVDDLATADLRTEQDNQPEIRVRAVENIHVAYNAARGMLYVKALEAHELADPADRAKAAEDISGWYRTLLSDLGEGLPSTLEPSPDEVQATLRSLIDVGDQALTDSTSRDLVAQARAALKSAAQSAADLENAVAEAVGDAEIDTVLETPDTGPGGNL